VEPTFPKLQISNEPQVDVQELLDILGNDNVTIWDARSPEEYRGEKILAARGGHIPGAINCEWTSLMDPDKHYRIREDAEDRLGMLGIRRGQDIITHCQTHHRSAFTYMVGKILGFDIRAYPGSWSEWGNLPGTPVEDSSH
jgi:thiosulfate/3-mercaptopyruvate sulfurtransferase